MNWLAAFVMTVGMSLLLIGIAQTSVWGWGSAKSLGLIVGGLAVLALWVVIEVRSDHPLVDMTMMRIRGVWTTNLAAFLVGAGMGHQVLGEAAEQADHAGGLAVVPAPEADELEFLADRFG